jgi:hypothetical protein
MIRQAGASLSLLVLRWLTIGPIHAGEAYCRGLEVVELVLVRRLTRSAGNT